MNAAASVVINDIEACVDATNKRKRGGRETSAMDDRTYAIYQLLLQYYEHPNNRDGGSGTGKHVLAKMAELGIVGASHSGTSTPLYLDLPPPLRLVEEAIANLNPVRVTVIRMIHRDGAKIEIVARHIHMSHGQAKKILRESRYAIGFYLEAKGLRLPKERC